MFIVQTYLSASDAVRTGGHATRFLLIKVGPPSELRKSGPDIEL